jgi:hypothetical protein
MHMPRERHSDGSRPWTAVLITVALLGTVPCLLAPAHAHNPVPPLHIHGFISPQPQELGVIRDDFPELSRNHTEGHVHYEFGTGEECVLFDLLCPARPPVGGDHSAIWQACRFYDQPIYNEHAVHSLEHGAIWIAYQDTLPATEIALIEAITQEPGIRSTHVLAAPWDEVLDGPLPAPIVLSAWRAQVWVDDITDPVVDEFIDDYIQGGPLSRAPEADAPCSISTTGSNTTHTK